MVSNKSLGDFVAESMSQVLNSEEHQRIFGKTRVASTVKTASAEKHPTQEVFDLLIEASRKLEEMGLSISATRTLQAAEDMITELKKSAHIDPDMLGVMHGDNEYTLEHPLDDFLPDSERVVHPVTNDLVGESRWNKEDFEPRLMISEEEPEEMSLESLLDSLDQDEDNGDVIDTGS